VASLHEALLAPQFQQLVAVLLGDRCQPVECDQQPAYFLAPLLLDGLLAKK
jgi:hypothetical protein